MFVCMYVDTHRGYQVCKVCIELPCAPLYGAYMGFGLGELEDLVGAYLCTKYGAHLIILTH